MPRGRTINTCFILEFSDIKIKILRLRPLMTGTSDVIRSQPGKVYYALSSLTGTYQHWISILLINLMLIKVRFLCTCTVMDDAKSLAWACGINQVQSYFSEHCIWNKISDVFTINKSGIINILSCSNDFSIKSIIVNSSGFPTDINYIFSWVSTPCKLGVKSH